MVRRFWDFDSLINRLYVLMIYMFKSFDVSDIHANFMEFGLGF